MMRVGAATIILDVRKNAPVRGRRLSNGGIGHAMPKYRVDPPGDEHA